MLNVTTAFNEAFKSDLREVKMRIKINDVTYTDEDIVSFNYNAGSIVGESFAIGSTYANSIKLTLCKIVEGLKQLDEVIPEMGIVLPDGSIEWVKLGTFIISEEVNPDRNENRTSLECTDKMIMLDDIYESKLNYPAKIRDVALEIANLAGVEVDKVSFGRLMENTIRKPTGYTFRQALGLIAQFEAGYACFDRNGLLAIRTLEDKNYEVTPNEYFQKGLVKNELMFRPAGIRVRINGESEEDKILKIGNEKGSVINLENRVMTDQLLRLVYDKVKTVNYYPYTLNWRGNPAIEVGDWLRVTDLKGNQFKIPNLSYSLEYKGGLTATSTVETVASNEVRFGYKKILDQVVELVENSIKDLDGNVIYYGVGEPPNPKEGDTWFKYVDSDTEIWVYEKVAEPDIFDWVFKISSAVDNSIKEAIEKLEQTSIENTEKVDQALIDAESARNEAKIAREEAFDSSVIAKNAEKDALNALAKGDSNRTEIEKLDGQQKLTNTKVEGNTANILSLQTDSEKLSLSIGKMQADVENTQSELVTFEATMKGFQTTVNSDISGLKSQQTQIDSQITSIVGTQESFINKKNLIPKWIVGGLVWATGIDYEANDRIKTDFINVEPKNTYTISLDGEEGFLSVFQYDSNFKILTDTSYNAPVRSKIETLEKARYVKLLRNGTTNTQLKLQLEKGNTISPYTPCISDVSSSQIIQLSNQITQVITDIKTVDGKVVNQQSQITQLSNNINLKVDKDNVIAQINLSPEQVLIQAKRIHLSGESLIDNAVIKTAHIDNLAVTGAKIQDATISSAKIISLQASKVIADTLSAITTNTGTLNVSGWLNVLKENMGIRGEYDYADDIEVVYPRYYAGDYRLSHRHLIFTSHLNKVNADGTRGDYEGYGESFYGANYFKSRWYVGSVTNLLKGRIDIRDDFIQVSDSWATNEMAGTFIKPKIIYTQEINVQEITARTTGSNIYFNRNRPNLADFRIGLDGSSLAGGRVVQSTAIYNRTYSSAANMIITSDGVIGRSTSARKYKEDILIADNVIQNAKNILLLKPKSWFDKGEVLDGKANKRYHGFIADEFDELNLKEVVVYGEYGQVESLAYDRISMYHNVILSEHEDRLNKLEEMLHEQQNRNSVKSVS